MPKTELEGASSQGLSREDEPVRRWRMWFWRWEEPRQAQHHGIQRRTVFQGGKGPVPNAPENAKGMKLEMPISFNSTAVVGDLQNHVCHPIW